MSQDLPLRPSPHNFKIRHDMDRAIRPPPNSRRALFPPPTRPQRSNPPSIRPDTAHQFAEDDLVERDEKGEYKVNAPSNAFKSMVLGVGREIDEELEQENQMIDLYGKQNAHWDPVAVEEEIGAALKSSLRRKTAGVEDDRWMFERGGEGKK